MAIVRTLAAAIIVTGAFGCGTAADQDDRERPMMIESEVSCVPCSIVIDPVVTLQGVYFRGPHTLLARDSAGSFYVVDSGDNLLKVYGMGGRYLRQIGRHGGGPGEYETIRNVLVARDGSIHVLDSELSRHSRFSADGQFLGSTTSPALIGGIGLAAAFLPDDRLVVVSQITRASNGAADFQVIDHDGSAFSVGAEESRHGPGRPWLQQRQLWVRPDGHVLVARPYTFEIDVYTPDFTEKLEIRRDAEWIPSRAPEQPPSDGVFDSPLTPALRGMWEDAEGLLWLHMVVPSREWKPAPPPQDLATTMSREDMIQLANRPRRRTIIEVVDLSLRRVVARMDTDVTLGTPFAGGYYARDVEDDTSQPGLEIVRLRLVRYATVQHYQQTA